MNIDNPIAKSINQHFGNHPHPTSHYHAFHLMRSKGSDDRSIECLARGIIAMVEENCRDTSLVCPLDRFDFWLIMNQYGDLGI